MKVSSDFISREIAGEFMLVPVGSAAASFNGLISLNEIGNFIFNALKDESTKDDVIDKILSEYEIDRQTAETDLEDFLDQLRKVGALVE